MWHKMCEILKNLKLLQAIQSVHLKHVSPQDLDQLPSQQTTSSSLELRYLVLITQMGSHKYQSLKSQKLGQHLRHRDLKGSIAALPRTLSSLELGKGLRSKVYQVQHNACFFYMKEGECPLPCTTLNSFVFLKSACKILDQSLNLFRTILINVKHGYSACT